MKEFIINNKSIIVIATLLFILICSISKSSAVMSEYEDIETTLGIVNTDYLNMRSGSNIDFDAIDLLTKNEYVRIFGKIGDWYIVQNEENNIGTVHSKYITPATEEKASATNTEVIKESTPLLTQDEEYLFNKINEERRRNNLSDFILDENLQNVARLKAEDIVKNNYFSHTSKEYGTPFEMLKTFNITYKTASENIAGNPNLDDALLSWMNSDGHKKNLLSNDYNYTAIAVVDSIAYGNIIVQLFIGR